MVSKTFRDFGRVKDAVEVPNLVAVQRASFDKFLQFDVPPTQRGDFGLESLFREIFPIESYDKKMRLEYVYYELEKPHYTPKECRQLRLTYAFPLKLTCRLKTGEGEDLAEQAIYLGEIPVMVGGGEFIVNGAVRVIVSQLHRSPGVDFLVESKEGDRVLHGGRIIPERGSWIEIGVTPKDVMVVKIDQSSKIPATVFLRAINEAFGTTEDLIRLFYDTKVVSTKKLEPTMWTVGPVVDTETGEILIKAGAQLADKIALIQSSELKDLEVVTVVRDQIILTIDDVQTTATFNDLNEADNLNRKGVMLDLGNIDGKDLKVQFNDAKEKKTSLDLRAEQSYVIIKNNFCSKSPLSFGSSESVRQWAELL